MKRSNKVKMICLTSSLLTLMMGTFAHAETVGTVTATSLNVRQEPSTSASIVDKAYYGEKLSILSKDGNWYKVKLSDDKIAYVSSNFIKPVEEQVTSTTLVPEISAKVNVPILNFRATPEIINSNIIGKLNQNENITILSTQGDWSYISTGGGQVGYVFTTYISQVSSSKVEANGDIRSQAVTYAKQFLGNPYVYGGTNLYTGIDCSSFTQQILRKFGYNISRTSYTQIHDGTPVAFSNLIPGDLIFYGFSGVISHVAMYIGDGKIIHASSPSTGVIISGMYSQGRKPVIGAVRIIE